MHDAAEKILKLVNAELARVPKAEQRAVLLDVVDELVTWSKAGTAGRRWERWG